MHGAFWRGNISDISNRYSTSSPSPVMDFPPDWEAMGAEDFTTAGPRNAGPCGMELLAQVRPNGRILDHYRVTLGGSRILDINCKLSELLQHLRPPGIQESHCHHGGRPAGPSGQTPGGAQGSGEHGLNPLRCRGWRGCQDAAATAVPAWFSQHPDGKASPERVS